MNKNKYLVLIITCWCLLFIALIAKLLGADIFYPSTNNQTFIAICDYVETHIWLKYTLSCVMSLILNSICFLAILEQKFYTKLQAIILIPLIIVMSLVGWYSQLANIILCVVICIILGLFLKKKWYRVPIGIGFIALFQIISILTKNIGHWYLNDENTLIAILLQVDSIIMSLLYYLYSNYIKYKKENK